MYSLCVFIKHILIHILLYTRYQTTQSPRLKQTFRRSVVSPSSGQNTPDVKCDTQAYNLHNIAHIYGIHSLHSYYDMYVQITHFTVRSFKDMKHGLLFF
jgi:hypothetical protein